jgi:hypothetical protein
MRQTLRLPLIWILAVAAVVVVVIAAAACGSDDDDGSGDTVSAAEWSDNMCTAVGFWREQMDAIAADAATQTEASVRRAVEQALVVTEDVIDAIDAPGVPDTENGAESAEQVSSWANGAINDLNQAQAALDAETGGDTSEELRLASDTIASVIESGQQVLRDIALTDPELGQAIRDSAACQEAQVGVSG